jgi:hypothetical protein
MAQHPDRVAAVRVLLLGDAGAWRGSCAHSGTRVCERAAQLVCGAAAGAADALRGARTAGAGKTSLAQLLATGAAPEESPPPTQGCDVFVRLLHVPDAAGGALPRARDPYAPARPRALALRASRWLPCARPKSAER